MNAKELEERGKLKKKWKGKDPEDTSITCFIHKKSSQKQKSIPKIKKESPRKGSKI